MQRIAVNNEQCNRIANIVKDLKLKPSYFNRDVLKFQADTEAKLRAYLYAAAICHQTHSLISKKKNLKGWNYVEHVFMNLAKENSELLDPDYLVTLSSVQLADKLRQLFSGGESECTLDRVEERSEFIIDIARLLKDKYGSHVSNLLDASNGFLLHNGNGLYELLEAFPAFSDPLRKKTTVFLKFAEGAHLFKVKDPENLVPMMDYHQQRILLRTGCVEVTDAKLRGELSNKTPIDSDKDVRDICIEAIRLISSASGKSINQTDDIFWTLARSCCNKKTLCSDGECNRAPCTFTLAVDLPSHDKCVFDGVCKGSADVEYRQYWQPIVETHYY